MVRNTVLRAVEHGDAAVKTPILDAAERGTRVEELRAMRRRLAMALDDPETHPRDLSPLMRRQIEISREIETLTVSDGPDSITAKADDSGGWDQSAI